MQNLLTITSRDETFLQDFSSNSEANVHFEEMLNYKQMFTWNLSSVYGPSKG